MGYNLIIGQAVIDWNEDFVRIDCENARADYAPAHGDPTDFTNQRWPSYSAWADFCRELDIMDAMFNERNKGAGEFEWQGKYYQPLLQDHPGAQPISRAHLEYIEDRIASYKAAHPDHRAEYPPPKPDAKPIAGTTIYQDDDYVDDPRYDGTLCRAEWLVFWLRWALDNCTQPVFVNS